jgi:protein SCO1
MGERDGVVRCGLMVVVSVVLVSCGGSAPTPEATSSSGADVHAGGVSIGHEGALPPVDPEVSLPAYGFYAIRLDRAVPKRDFTLTAQSGEPFSFARDTAGKVTLLYFGYTHCPDLCPSELATVATALRGMPTEVAEQIRMVFVSVDPERDDVEQMRSYVHLFDEDFVGLTGAPKAIRGAQLLHGVEPAVRVPSGADGYAMRHSAEVLVFTPDSRAHLAFPFGMTALQMRHDLWRLVTQGWRDR